MMDGLDVKAVLGGSIEAIKSALFIVAGAFVGRFIVPLIQRVKIFADWGSEMVLLSGVVGSILLRNTSIFREIMFGMAIAGALGTFEKRIAPIVRLPMEASVVV